MTQEIAVLSESEIDLVFGDEGKCAEIIKRIQTEARSEVFDIETESGRKAAKSLAYKVAKTKAPVEDAAKRRKAGLQVQIKAINKTSSAFVAAMDDLRDEIKEPVLEWEQREQRRVQAIRDKVQVISDTEPGNSIEFCRKQLDDLAELEFSADEYQEFLGLAYEKRDLVVARVREKLEALIEDAERRKEAEAMRKKVEAQEREIARLREQAQKKVEDTPVEQEVVGGDAGEDAATPPDDPVSPSARDEAISDLMDIGFPRSQAEFILGIIMQGKVSHVRFTGGAQ